MLGRLLADALWLIPWGLLAACAAILLIALGGFFVQTRRMAGLCVALLGIGSTVTVLALTVGHSNASLDQMPFFVPGVVASGIGLWLAFAARPDQNAATGRLTQAADRTAYP